MEHALDLKKEIILTMLSQLEKEEDGQFIKLESNVHAYAGIRFHYKKPEELAEESAFIREAIKVSKVHQGVHRICVPEVAEALGVTPFEIGSMLFDLQRKEEISYDLDSESFTILVKAVPEDKAMELATRMLQQTRKIEAGIVSKLHCMYLVGRSISLPTIDILLKKIKKDTEEGINQETDELAYTNQTTKTVNKLIDAYFKVECEDDIESKMVGGREERDLLLPLLYLESHRQKADLDSLIRMLLVKFEEGRGKGNQKEKLDKMKPIDVTKILMGIYSDRLTVKKF